MNNLISTRNAERLTEEQAISLLVQRMGERGDMPGFSKSVQSIMSAMAEDAPQESNMAQTVLADVALTQKVLRLANSAMYSAFGSSVSTVSKAVLLLGTETIGHLALGLKVLDQLQMVSPDSKASQAEMSKAVLASQVARTCAGDIANVRDAEEAAVCGMLHGLGRILVSFYLPEHWVLIDTAEEADIQNTNAQQWLGVSLEGIGRRMAERWGLPKIITRTIDVPDLTLTELPLNHEQWLTVVSAFSSEAAGALVSGKPDDAVQALAHRYGSVLGAEPQQLMLSVRAAHRFAVQENLLAGLEITELEATLGKPIDSLGRLRQGVVDLQDASGTSSGGQLITLALETLHQAFGFSHSFAFARQPQQFAAKIGFGPQAKELMDNLMFDAAYEPHVFHAALSRDMAVYIENAQAPQLLDKIPRCWRDSMGSARSFLLVPLTAQGRPFGLLIGAWDDTAGSARVTHEEMVPVNELRNIVGTALMRRKQANEAAGQAKAA